METDVVPDTFHTRVVDCPAVMTVGLASKVLILGSSETQLGLTTRSKDRSNNGINFFIASSPDVHSFIFYEPER